MIIKLWGCPPAPQQHGSIGGPAAGGCPHCTSLQWCWWAGTQTSLCGFSGRAAALRPRTPFPACSSTDLLWWWSLPHPPPTSRPCMVLIAPGLARASGAWGPPGSHGKGPHGTQTGSWTTWVLSTCSTAPCLPWWLAMDASEGCEITISKKLSSDCTE